VAVAAAVAQVQQLRQQPKRLVEMAVLEVTAAVVAAAAVLERPMA
jgi:hypothetical protein